MIVAEACSGQDQIIAAATLLRKRGRGGISRRKRSMGWARRFRNLSAVRRIFEIKKRPADHPLIVHLADVIRLEHWARDVPDQAWRLAERFWPGPLTLILPRSGRCAGKCDRGPGYGWVAGAGSPCCTRLAGRTGARTSGCCAIRQPVWPH